MPKWLDLSPYKAKLVGMEFPDGKKRLVIMGLPPDGVLWNLSISRLGFRPAKSGRTLVRDDVHITPKDFRQVFMLCRIREMPREEIVYSVAPTATQRANRKDDLDLRTVQYLGLNYLGQQVFEGEAGRHVKNLDRVTTENDAENPAAFLRSAGSDTVLAQCADGFVNEMVHGKIMRPADLKRFVEIIASPAEPEPGIWPYRVQEAVEAAIQRRVAAFDGDFAAHYRFAVAMYERQPVFSNRTSKSVINQQFSTPPPGALLCQRLLGDTTGKTVLEPTIGNGSMVMALPAGTEIYGTEIDPERVNRADMLREDIVLAVGDATEINFKNMLPEDQRDGFDFVIGNPPFGGIETVQVIDKLRVTRLDHQILMRSLAARKPDGSAVFIIGADHENMFPGKGGLISGGSKNLFNWLADHYQINDAFELNGKLYEKQGSTYPVRVVAIGRRRSDEEAARALEEKTYRLEKLPVINSWDEALERVEAVSLHLLSAPGKTAPPAAAVIEDQATALEEKPSVAPTAPFRVDEEEARAEANLIENAFQAPYIPLSTVGEANSMVPRNLLAPSQVALTRLAADIGVSVEDFVADKLNTPGFDRDHLASVFSPEQIDAVALGIRRVESGQGFLVGDMTGLGKGRVLAAMALYAINNQGREVVFLTDKPNLFSDFWRDVEDICGERIDPVSLFKPLILNSGVDIRDQKNNRIFRATSSVDREKVMEHDGHGQNNPLTSRGYNIMFGTYSQFNRETAKSKKAAWLPLVAAGNVLILDESHNAAGLSSNTAANIAAAMDSAWGTCYSSATSIKTADQMLAYAKIFPKGVCNESLPETLSAGGEPLQEIISAMLVEDGALVRREHDLSRLTFDTRLDEKNLARNEMMSDHLSSILLAMSHFSGDVNGTCGTLNKQFEKNLKSLPAEARKGQRMSASSVNFGSRLYTILRQFLLAISVDATVEAAVQHLKEGRKPVIVVEQTMESLLKEVLSNTAMDGDEDVANNLNGQTFPTLTFRELLERLLDKISVITERNDYGSVSQRRVWAYAKTPEQKKALMETVKHLRALISTFPDLPISPLDTIRERLEKEGFRCGEISGRGMTVVEKNGETTVSLRSDDRLRTIYEFNNGEVDAVILTRAGSTGLSLHSSSQFADQRQRVLIELQIPNNVAERIQFFGRVNRKGQVSEPLIETVSTGLPGQVRILAMQNAKLRKLSANTQSSRENAAEMENIPDILNEVGNKICHTFLENNSEVAYLLGIVMDPEGIQGDVDNTFANKLTGRIALLPIKQQRQIYEEIFKEYETFLKEAEAQGVNPFKTKEYNLKAEIVNRAIFEGVELPRYSSAFSKLVYVATLQWDEVIAPVRFSKLQEMIAAGRHQLAGDFRVSKPVGDNAQYSPERLCEIIHNAFTQRVDMALEALKDKFGSLQEALNSKEPNSIKNIDFRRKWLIKAAQDILPGNIIETIINGEPAAGVVLAVEYPGPGKEHNAGQYEVKIQRPGVERPDMLTFNMLMNNSYAKKVYLDITCRTVEEVFNSAPSGKITKQRAILDGNLFAAAQLAATNGLGRAAVFTDKDGVRHRAVMLRTDIKQTMLMNTKPRITDCRVAERLLMQERQLVLSSSASSENIAPDGVTIRWSGDSAFTIRCGGTKASGGKIFMDEQLVSLVGDFGGNKNFMTASFDMAVLPDALGRLEQIGCSFFVPHQYRERIQEISSEIARDDHAINETRQRQTVKSACCAA